MHSTAISDVSSPRLESDSASMIREVNEKSKVEIKIAYIGGGSREWAVKLMGDLALSERLTGSLSLYDIDLDAASHNKIFSQDIFGHPDARTRFEVRAEQRLEDALRGADFVVISIEPGPTSLRRADLEIPAQYGILQTVGDTTGPGGILRSLRSVPLLQEFARAIMDFCPKAWVINYTNPLAICVAALYAEAPAIKAFGCCHEVFGTQKKLAALVEQWFKVKQPEREEIALDIAGVNHFTWATKASWQGRDLMPKLREMIDDETFFQSRKSRAELASQTGNWFNNEALVAYDLLRRFGALGAAGDRHLVEFVPWYLSSEDELHRWGVVCTPYSWRLQRSKTPRPSLGSHAGKELRPSGEEGVQQIEALLGLRPLTTNVNLPNTGQLPGFPQGAIVESNAEFGPNSLRPITSGKLPGGAACFVRRAIEEQSLTLFSALNRDVDQAFQALLTHPLVHLPTDRAWTMFLEMIEATREMLPGWKMPSAGS
jgi:alpha-galactosidase/6-phospho-beta-glucosidase family protein